MIGTHSNWIYKAFVLVASLIAVGIGTSTCFAQSVNEILDALRARSETRALSPAEQTQEEAERRLIDALRRKAPRGLSVAERNQLHDVALRRPGIDLTVYFDFNSAELLPVSIATLQSLGKAISHKDLTGATLLVAGHTDAVGTAEYNQTLSQERTNTVVGYLQKSFDVSSLQIIAVGYGKEQLKNRMDPSSPENRRVQVVNLGR